MLSVKLTWTLSLRCQRVYQGNEIQLVQPLQKAVERLHGAEQARLMGYQEQLSTLSSSALSPGAMQLLPSV